MLASSLSASLIVPTEQSYVASSDVLLNGDFETGTFAGWDNVSNCGVQGDIFHNGSYAAYVASDGYDNWARQSFYPSVLIRVDTGILLEGYVYPLRVGWLGAAYPFSAVVVWFYNTTSGQLAGYILYSWCLSIYATEPCNVFIWGWNKEQWNYLSRNVTADASFVYGSEDISELALGWIEVRYHYSDLSPGAFYVDDLKVFAEVSAHMIADVVWFPTCPPPYVPSLDPRINEPVAVKANVTGSIAKVLLNFRRSSGEWYNVSMVFNETEMLWCQIIQAQSEACTVEFFIEAWVTFDLHMATPLYSFNVKDLPTADINGDEVVNMLDLYIVATNYGQTSP